MLWLSLNTNKLLDFSREDIPSSIHDLAMKIVGRKQRSKVVEVEGPFGPVIVNLVRSPGAAFYSLFTKRDFMSNPPRLHDEAQRIACCILALTREGENFAWENVKELHQELRDVPIVDGGLFSRDEMPPRPIAPPWLFFAATPAFVGAGKASIDWCGNLERAITWAILDQLSTSQH